MSEKILKLNRKQRRNITFNKSVTPIDVVTKKDENGDEVVIAYLHPRKGYKGNKKSIEILKTRQRGK